MALQQVSWRNTSPITNTVIPRPIDQIIQILSNRGLLVIIELCEENSLIQNEHSIVYFVSVCSRDYHWIDHALVNFTQQSKAKLLSECEYALKHLSLWKITDSWHDPRTATWGSIINDVVFWIKWVNPAGAPPRIAEKFS